MGPTASGKTDLALALCDSLPCDIISVDSALIYRGMDIGTAKPDKAILQRYPHRLVDICDPIATYSVADFCEDAKKEIMLSLHANRIPLLVGGSMLYFRGLTQGLSTLPSSDPFIRSKIREQAELLGWPAMHARLAMCDPESAGRLHPNDAQRIGRALEVFEMMGRSMSEYWRISIEASTFSSLCIGLFPDDRQWLHQRIEQRFHHMIAEGFIGEVETLYHRGDCHLDLPSMRCVGYRQVWQYLAGVLSHEQMVQQGIVATRQLAKRQLTWLRSWPELQRCDPRDPQLFTKIFSLISQRSA